MAAPASRGLVLLAEDDAPLRTATERLLKRAGYAVLTAVDGVDALARVAEAGDALRLVITDLDMPRLDGLELQAVLAREHPQLPVLLVTGRLVMDPGPGVLRKPFFPQELLSRVEALVDNLSLTGDRAAS